MLLWLFLFILVLNVDEGWIYNIYTQSNTKKVILISQLMLLWHSLHEWLIQRHDIVNVRYICKGDSLLWLQVICDHALSDLFAIQDPSQLVLLDLHLNDIDLSWCTLLGYLPPLRYLDVFLSVSVMNLSIS